MDNNVTPEVCPGCGSGNLVSRGRRFYDIVLTWLRAAVWSGILYPDYDSGWSLIYTLPADEMPSPPSFDTPRRFFRCRDCDERWSGSRDPETLALHSARTDPADGPGRPAVTTLHPSP